MGKRKANGRKRVQKDTVLITLSNGSSYEVERNVRKVRNGQTLYYIPCQDCYEFVWLKVTSEEFKKGLCPKCARNAKMREIFQKVVKRNGPALKRLAESDGE